jgi:hypothetical protein
VIVGMLVVDDQVDADDDQNDKGDDHTDNQENIRHVG